METAGEGGPWGVAILASYMVHRAEGESLAEFLDSKVFGDDQGTEISPEPEDVKGFEEFMERYKKGLAIEQAAVENLR